MLLTKAYGAQSANSPIAPMHIERREPGPNDVLIDILYCGICHSDVHFSRGQWPGVIFPIVPGHEIVGKVARVGSAVTKHAVGDIVGVGTYVDSCRVCSECQAGEEHFCDSMVPSYSAYERDGKTVTYGGYSTHITVDENYVLRIPTGLSPAGAAPLLCAGITTYSTLRHWKVDKGSRVAVIGLGGLGHIAVKLASAMGAEVTVISTSDAKKDDAIRFGANNFVNAKVEKVFAKLAGQFDLIVNTVSGSVDYDGYVSLLKRDGALVVLGVPDGSLSINLLGLLFRRRSVASSMLGGIRETQEMLDFCAEHRIESDVEVIRIDEVNDAYERMLKSDVRYRFVIDLKSLR